MKNIKVGDRVTARRFQQPSVEISGVVVRVSEMGSTTIHTDGGGEITVRRTDIKSQQGATT